MIWGIRFGILGILGFLTATVGGIERHHLAMLVGRPTGVLPWELRELSGLAHCRTTPKYLWAINDRGGKALLHKLSLKAKLQQIYHLVEDSNKDWEDLACGRCVYGTGECLYIGDIGSNSAKRRKIKIYMLPLPIQWVKTAAGKIPYREKFSLSYPKGGYNAETLLVHPKKPLLLIVTKEKTDPNHQTDPKLFGIDLSQLSSKKGILKFEGTLPFSHYLTKRDPPASAWATGGDFYPDGQWFILMTYTHIYRIPWPLPDQVNQRILLPIWGNVNRTQLESIAFHYNGKQFWLGSEVNRSREPLLLMELPLQR